MFFKYSSNVKVDRRRKLREEHRDSLMAVSDRKLIYSLQMTSPFSTKINSNWKWIFSRPLTGRFSKNKDFSLLSFPSSLHAICVLIFSLKREKIQRKRKTIFPASLFYFSLRGFEIEFRSNSSKTKYSKFPMSKIAFDVLIISCSQNIIQRLLTENFPFSSREFFCGTEVSHL